MSLGDGVWKVWGGRIPGVGKRSVSWAYPSTTATLSRATGSNQVTLELATLIAKIK